MDGDRMTSLPDSLTYGFVRQRFVQSVADTRTDPDRRPDARPESGTVSFTGRIQRRVLADTPFNSSGYVGIRSTPKIFRLGSNGQLTDANNLDGVWLVTGIYDVKIALDGGLQWPEFAIEVTEDHTEENPLWLLTQAPLPDPGPGIVHVVTEESRLAAEAAADRAEAASLDTGWRNISDTLTPPAQFPPETISLIRRIGKVVFFHLEVPPDATTSVSSSSWAVFSGAIPTGFKSPMDETLFLHGRDATAGKVWIRGGNLLVYSGLGLDKSYGILSTTTWITEEDLPTELPGTPHP